MDSHIFPAVVAVNALAIAVAVFVAARDYPSRMARAMDIFCAGKILVAAAYVLIALRSFLPDTLTVVGANMLAIAGISTNYATVRELQGKSRRFGLAAAIVILSGAAGYFLSYLPQDLRGVRAATSAAGMILVGLVTYELLLRYRRSGRAHIICGIVGLAMFSVMSLRLVHAIMSAPLPLNEQIVDPVEAVFDLAILFGSAIGTITLVLLTNDEFNAELTRLIGVDALSGVANRRRLTERGEEEFRRAVRSRRPFAAMLIDIDHFKQINDRWGHGVGDRAIRALADCCTATVRDVDVVGRLGGEEFVVLMPDTDPAAAAEVAERVRRAVAAIGLATNSGENFSMTVSIGVANLGGDSSFDALLERADRAMYQAKSDGRDRVRMADAAMADTALPVTDGAASLPL